MVLGHEKEGWHHRSYGGAWGVQFLTLSCGFFGEEHSGDFFCVPRGSRVLGKAGVHILWEDL